MPLQPTRRPSMLSSSQFCQFVPYLDVQEREGEALGLREHFFGNALLHTHHTAQHHTPPVAVFRAPALASP